MDGTTGDTTLSATSSAPAGRFSPRPPATTLAGLIDVLDQADGPVAGAARRRLPAHRSAAPGAGGSRSAGLRPNGFRATATRNTPLRSVQPAPTARRPAAAVVVEPGSYWDMTRPPAPAAPAEDERTGTRCAALIRRAAMWGAGPAGENLSWRTSMAPTAPVRAPRDDAPREPRLRALVRRVALWGAGDDGANLAWRSSPVPVPRRLDPPVVLREMPSTPLIQPAATSPAAALVPAVPVSGPRPVGPVLPRVAPVEPVGWCARADAAEQASPAASGWPAPPTGWPQPPEWPPAERAALRRTPPRLSTSQVSGSQVSASQVSESRVSPHPMSTPPVSTRSGRATESRPAVPAARFPSPRERGLARARGDPLSFPARGSPPRRPNPPTPSARVWSPAASLPPPRPAHAAPG